MEIIERASRGLVRDIWDCLVDERVSVHPPAIAFNLLACGVPFLLVLVSALGFFFTDQAAREAVTGFILSQLPVRLGGPVKAGHLIEHALAPLVEHRRAAAVAGLGVLYLAGSALMQSMRLALNQVFHVPIRRGGLSAHLYEIAAFGFVGALVFLGAASVWGLSIVIPQALPLLRFTDDSVQAATRWVTSMVLTAGNLGLFYGLYRYLPDENPTHRTALVASLLCTGLLFAAKEVSEKVLDRVFGGYNVIYGAYAAIALGAIWLYYAAFIFVVCAAFGRTLDRNLKSRSRSRALILPLLILTAARPAAAQIDPERRQLLQMGLNQAVDGRGPLAAYAYYYLNAPHFLSPRKTLRLVVAPGYVDSELGLAQALGAKTDLGLGLAGGAFADSQTEIRRDRFIKGESYRGDGVRAALSVYHDFPSYGPVPLAGILRVEGHHAKFTRDKATDPAFALPEAQSEVAARAGLRLGGKEPLLMPNVAMEVSAWYEGRRRLAPGSYGFHGDRRIESDSHLFWGRALIIYNKSDSAQRFVAVLTGGTSFRADRLSAYRLGGELPMAAEFPLSLPGYYYEEISARRFTLLGGSYIVPVSRDKKTWTTSVTASTALVDYAPGLAQRGKSHTGVGLGGAYLSRSNAWQVLAGYGYGVNAARGHGNGGHTVGLLMQFDFQRVAVPFFHPADPNKGLQHMLLGTRPLPLPSKFLPKQ